MALRNDIGQEGGDYVAAATVNAHSYKAITAISAPCVVTTVSLDTDKWDSLSAVAVPAGTTIYGRWSSVTIGTGDTAMVYRVG